MPEPNLPPGRRGFGYEDDTRRQIEPASLVVSRLDLSTMPMASSTRVYSPEKENHVTSPPHLARGASGSTSLEEDSTFPADFRLHAQHATRLAGMNSSYG